MCRLVSNFFCFGLVLLLIRLSVCNMYIYIYITPCVSIQLFELFTLYVVFISKIYLSLDQHRMRVPLKVHNTFYSDTIDSHYKAAVSRIYTRPHFETIFIGTTFYYNCIWMCSNIFLSFVLLYFCIFHHMAFANQDFLWLYANTAFLLVILS